MMKARVLCVLCVLGTTGLAASLGACSSMPKPDKDSFSTRSGVAAGQAVDQTYDGFGDAAQAPLRDLNMVHDKVPPILVRAFARPYDQNGLDTCPAISEQVRQLDLALGPDVDIPRGESAEQDMFSKGASFAADAALDAVRSATTGVIPVRSWVRRFSGANRAEQEAKAVVLAGAVRRGYLKALGQVRGCDWPAAPLKPQTAEAIRAKLTADPALPPAALEAAAHTAAASGQLQAPPAKPQN
jgi:hypothetical protein